MSSRILKSSAYSLAALSAALIVYAGSATAGDPTNSIRPISFQEAVRNVLTGDHRFHAAPESQTTDVGTVKPTVSMQEGVQEVLLGTSRFQIGFAQTTGRTGVSRDVASAARRAQRSPVDTQASVQRMLRGERFPAGPVA